MATIGNHPLVIDRPQGYEKTFTTLSGPVTKAYPVDYGYLQGLINPDDNEDLDVFVGNGDLYGRFMKGRTLSGQWEPDERKWYYRLTPEQLTAVQRMFNDQYDGLLRDYAEFPDEQSFLADVQAAAGLKEEPMTAKTAQTDSTPDTNTSPVGHTLERTLGRTAIRLPLIAYPFIHSLAVAPASHRDEGFSRGAGYTLGTSLGLLGGALGGGALAGRQGAFPGGLAGATLGVLLARKLMGPPSWEQSDKPKKQASLNNRDSLGRSSAGESGLQIYMAPWSVNGDDAWGEVGNYRGDNPPRLQRKLVTVGEKHAAELGAFGRGFVQEFIGRPEHELYRAAKLASDYAPEIAEELAPLLKQAISPSSLWGAIRGGAGNAVSKARAGASRAGNFLAGRSQAPGFWGAMSRNVVGPAAQGSAQMLQSVGRVTPLVNRLVPRAAPPLSNPSRGFISNMAREAGGIGTATGLGYGADRLAEAMGVEGGLGFAETAGLLRTGHGLARSGALTSARGGVGRTLGGNAMQAAGQGIVGQSVGEGAGAGIDMFTDAMGLGNYDLATILGQAGFGVGALRGSLSGLGRRLTNGQYHTPLRRFVGSTVPKYTNVASPQAMALSGAAATAGAVPQISQGMVGKQLSDLTDEGKYTPEQIATFQQAGAELSDARRRLYELQEKGAPPDQLAAAQQAVAEADARLRELTPQLSETSRNIWSLGAGTVADVARIADEQVGEFVQAVDPLFEELTGQPLSNYNLTDPEQRQTVVSVLQQSLNTVDEAQAKATEVAESLKQRMLEMAGNNPEYQQRLAAMGPEEVAQELGGLIDQAKEMGVQLDENGKLAMPGGGLLAGIPFLEDMGPWGTLAVLLGAGMVLGGLMSGGGGEGGGGGGALMGGLALGGLALGWPYLSQLFGGSEAAAAPPVGAPDASQVSQAPQAPAAGAGDGIAAGATPAGVGPIGQAGTQPGFAEHGDEAAPATDAGLVMPGWMQQHADRLDQLDAEEAATGAAPLTDPRYGDEFGPAPAWDSRGPSNPPQHVNSPEMGLWILRNRPEHFASWVQKMRQLPNWERLATADPALSQAIEQVLASGQ